MFYRIRFLPRLDGFLEIRGKSARIKHYEGYKDGKRLYYVRKVPSHLLHSLIPIDSQITLGIKTLKLKSISKNTGARGLVRIRTLACGAGNPGFKSPRARHF